jgi:cystathionine beta-lyase/cystathionine gamma-synthase
MKNLDQLNTLFNHVERTVTSPQQKNFPLLAPMHESVKYSFEDFNDFERFFKGEIDGYVYSRVNHPNAQTLADLISIVTEKDCSLVFSSGIGSITATLLGLTEPGDHIVSFFEGYSPTRQFISKELQEKGVISHLFFFDEFEKIEDYFKKYSPRLIFFESPTNPQLSTLDIARLLSLAKKYKVLTVIDNTFNGFHNFENEMIDIVIHSLTKFATGHGDILAGSVSGKKSLIEKIHKVQIWMGNILGAYYCQKTLQYLKTYSLRYAKALENAQKLADDLDAHPQIDRLYYPEIRNTLRNDRGCVISFEIKGNLADFFNRLKLIKVSASLGSTETLIAPCALFYGFGLSDQQRLRMKLTPKLVRLSVGIESFVDLQKDLHNALSPLD